VSATHTRFSHAIGTMLVMNKLFKQVQFSGLPKEVFEEAGRNYPAAVTHFGGEREMVHCHLLLVALYQDVGELPFQKVTSLYFHPADNDVTALTNLLPKARPKTWNGKKVFSVLSLIKDIQNRNLNSGFKGYDCEFLSFLMTGDGLPSGAKALAILLQMVDGVIDADRLDYVYRDASVTIGSVGQPSTVLESIISYQIDKVIVNDPRPVTDFISTRMRLWTFVYSAADVRFRQVLLKTLLEGRWDRDKAGAAFDAAHLDPELTHDGFMALDDYSLLTRIRSLDVSHLEKFRQEAKSLLLSGILDYECKIIRRNSKFSDVKPSRLPADLFFDLMADHGHHQLYRPSTVEVRQNLTSSIADYLPLEDNAGAFSPLFSEGNSAMLVRGGFYLFLPRQKHGGLWTETIRSLDDSSIFARVVWEDARRSLACPTDTLSVHVDKAINISYCSKDFPTVIRIVRELYRRKRRYKLFLRPFDGTGDTSAGNSEKLVTDAESMLVVASVAYLERALDGTTHISIEVRAMHDRADTIPLVVVGVDERDKLNAVSNWSWASLNEKWRDEKTVVPNDTLRNASEDMLRGAVDEAVRAVDGWKSPR
jgi:HD superfamily phosphohydrolase